MPGDTRKVILRNFQSPGDILMLTAAVRDLHREYPGQFLTDVRTSCRQLWHHNPHLTPIDGGDPEARIIDCEYPLIHYSNQRPYHFLHGFMHHLNRELRLAIRPTEFRGDIHLSQEEIEGPSRVHEIAGEDVPFWIVAAGGKFDYTIKWWEPARYQRVVDRFLGKVLFVQVGAKNHHHPPLERVLDLRGKTDLRDLVRLIYHAQGVLCPVTVLMHLAAAVPTKPGMPSRRACVVVAGGREPPHWEAYPQHQFIHTVGMLRCCARGGCWKSRVAPLGDGDEKDDPKWTCSDVVAGGLPRCMDMITADHVADRIRGYYRGGLLRHLTRAQARVIEEARIWGPRMKPGAAPRRNAIELRVFGMRRSGNHAILNWLASLFPNKVCFLNDLTHNRMPAIDQRCWDLPGLAEERRCRLCDPKGLLLYSFEDVPLETYGDFWLPRQMGGRSARRMTVLILRDPFNLFASRLKVHRDRPNNPFGVRMLLRDEDGASRLAERWVSYAREFAGQTAHLGRTTVTISYNRWVFDESYRRDLCRRLGGAYSEDTLEQVPRYGFGSSFEGHDRGRLAEPTGVVSRWRHFCGDPEFEELVGGDDLRRLTAEIFGAVRPDGARDPGCPLVPVNDSGHT